MKTEAEQTAMRPPGQEGVKSPTATPPEAARGKKCSSAGGEASSGGTAAPQTRLPAPATGENQCAALHHSEFGDLLQWPQETDTQDGLGFKPGTNSAPPLRTPRCPAVCLEASDFSFSDLLLTCFLLGFPGGARGKNLPANARDMGSMPWVENIPWRRKWPPTPVCLPGESHGQRSLAGYSPWGQRELDTTEHAHARFLFTGK